MEPSHRTVVAVRPAAALQERPRLAAALEAAFGVRLVPWEAEPAPEAVIDLAGGQRYTVPSFSALAADAPGVAVPEPVRIGTAERVDRRVRDIVLHDRLGAPLVPGAGEEVLAQGDAGPAWTVSREGPPAHRVSAVLPELGPGEVLYRLLSQRAIAMVALMHFLRGLSRSAPLPAPLRACVVFDDPNLRRPSYGYIDYRRLVTHADEHGYHAVMAMIPLDAGRAHRRTAALFAARPDRLSLVVHGNDHLDNELLSVTDDARALALAAQALRRVERFERRSGVPVDRVMMPPHGLCSRAMARALGAVGFDALCALHPQPWTSAPPSDPLLASWRPAEFVEGCPVIPRIPLISTDADIALRAFVDHPLVVYGHHEDVAGGLEPLADLAARVNRLGDVRWTSVGEIARTNHTLAVDGERATIAAYARRVTVELPAGVGSVAVGRPEGTGALTGWSVDGGEPLPFGAAIPARGRVEIALVAGEPVDASRVAAPVWTPWPRLRRAATEARDRLRPVRTRARMA